MAKAKTLTKTKKEIVKKKRGRPTSYQGEKTLALSEKYLKECVDEFYDYHSTRGEKSDTFQQKVKVKLPSIAGLAIYLGVHKETIYDWAKVNPRFSDFVKRLLAKQELALIEGSLSGTYNPLIAKVILTKHGYRDAVDTDVTSQGKKIDSIKFEFPEDVQEAQIIDSEKENKK